MISQDLRVSEALTTSHFLTLPRVTSCDVKNHLCKVLRSNRKQLHTRKNLRVTFVSCYKSTLYRIRHTSLFLTKKRVKLQVLNTQGFMNVTREKRHTCVSRCAATLHTSHEGIYIYMLWHM